MASCGLLLERACNNKKQGEREDNEEQLRRRMHIELPAGSGGLPERNWRLSALFRRCHCAPTLPCVHVHVCGCASPDGTLHANTLDPWFCVRLNSLALGRLNQSTQRWNQL